MDTLPAYSSGILPLLEGGEGPYAQREFNKLASVLRVYASMLPQAATQAPKNPADGMIRLSRNPWRPVAGQTVDKLVYYDAAGGVWRYLSTDPTNT